MAVSPSSGERKGRPTCSEKWPAGYYVSGYDMRWTGDEAFKTFVHACWYCRLIVGFLAREVGATVPEAEKVSIDQITITDLLADGSAIGPKACGHLADALDSQLDERKLESAILQSHAIRLMLEGDTFMPEYEVSFPLPYWPRTWKERYSTEGEIRRDGAWDAPLSPGDEFQQLYGRPIEFLNPSELSYFTFLGWMETIGNLVVLLRKCVDEGRCLLVENDMLYERRVIDVDDYELTTREAFGLEAAEKRKYGFHLPCPSPADAHDVEADHLGRYVLSGNPEEGLDACLDCRSGLGHLAWQLGLMRYIENDDEFSGARKIDRKPATLLAQDLLTYEKRNGERVAAVAATFYRVPLLSPEICSSLAAGIPMLSDEELSEALRFGQVRSHQWAFDGLELTGPYPYADSIYPEPREQFEAWKAFCGRFAELAAKGAKWSGLKLLLPGDEDFFR